MPASRRSRKHLKLGSQSSSQADWVAREFEDGSSKSRRSRRKKKAFPQAVNEVAKAIITRLDGSPDLPLLPLSRKEATKLQGVNGNAVDMVAQRINQTFEKRTPREKVAAHNAGRDSINSLDQQRNAVRFRKRVSLGVYEYVEFDSIRRIRVRRTRPKR